MRVLIIHVAIIATLQTLTFADVLNNHVLVIDPISSKDQNILQVQTLYKLLTGEQSSDTIPKNDTSVVIDSPKVIWVQYEVITWQDKTYQISLSSESKQLYKLRISRSLVKQTISGQSVDTSSVQSGVLLNPNVEYSVFNRIVKELLKEIVEVDIDADTELDYQLSHIYGLFMSTLRKRDDPFVIELQDRLSAYDGLLEEKFRYAGMLRIKNSAVKTFRHPTHATIKRERKTTNRKIDAAESKASSFEDSTRTLQDRIDSLYDSKGKYKSLENRLQLASIAEQDIRKLGDSIDEVKKLQDTLRSYKRQLKSSYIPTKGVFYLDSVYLEFFNNAVDKLLVFGKYNRDTSFDKTYRKSIQYNVAIRALNRSFGLRGLNLNDYYFLVNKGSENEYAIKLNELLTYSKYKNNFSYVVKDQSITLTEQVNSELPLERRAIYDYLSIISFIDFLGISNQINNNFMQIEGRARFPLKLSTLDGTRTFSNLSILPMFETFLNASFVNGGNLGGRKSDIFSNSSKDTLYYSHFDLLRNYNMKAGLSLSLFSLHYKSIHSRIYGVVDLKLYRSAFSFTQVNTGLDSALQSNVFSASYAPTIIFEYRPDFNIGADLRLSVDCGLSPFNFQSGEIKYFPSKGPIYSGTERFQGVTKRDKVIYGLELNAYSFLSPARERNDGLYFRFAMFTNRNLTEISPYLMAGYATSLKGLVKSNVSARPN